MSRFRFSAKKRRNRIVLSVLLAFVLILTPTVFVLADEADADINFPTQYGTSSSTLGESTIYPVSSVVELAEIEKLATDGDYSKVIISIENDFSVVFLGEWKPIGTLEKPFNGKLIGNGHTISGFGSFSHPSLFGHIKNATIENLTIGTVVGGQTSNPNFGLFEVAENSTVTGCSSVVTTSYLAMRGFGAYSTITPDTGWLTSASGGAHPTTPQVANERELWALAEAVNTGTSFSGKTITFTSDMNCQFQPFDGIGTPENPFDGSIDGNGKIIRNLSLTPGAGGTGLVSFADGSGATPAVLADVPTIKNIKIVNANVSGGENTGALVGYAKDYMVEDSSVSGVVSGSNNIGGLIGTLDISVNPFWMMIGDPSYINDLDFDSVPDAPFVSACYSTADVNGSNYVGGLIGQVTSSEIAGFSWTRLLGNTDDIVVEQCFTTGIVSGASGVGGIVGYLHGTNFDNYSYKLNECASLSRVNGSVNVGGLVGKAVSLYNAMLAMGSPQVLNSYFAGNAYGMDSLGGLIGANGGAENSYVSGNVIAPFLYKYLPSHIFPVVGYNAGYTLSLYSKGVFVVPGTVYRPGDKLNATTAADFLTYQTDYNQMLPEGVYGNEIRPLLQDSGVPGDYYDYFSNGAVAIAGGSFGGGSITIISDQVTGGTFPDLSSYSAGAYNTFSDISTDAHITNFPTDLYYRGGATNGKATISKGGAADFVLPTPAGLTWTVNGGSSYTFEDSTILPSGQNTITINGDGTISMAAPLKEDVKVVLVGSVASIEGFTVKFEVTFKDDAVRPAAGGIPEALKDTTAASAVMISANENIMSIYFEEKLTSTPLIVGDMPINLTKYADNNYGGVTTAIPSGAKITQIGDKIIKIEIVKTHLETGKSYSIDLGSGTNQFTDLAGNKVAGIYFFRMAANTPPALSFDDTFDLYANNTFGINTTNAAKTDQVIGMTENDTDYASYLDGVVVENAEGLIDLNAQPAGSYQFTKLTSMENAENYPSLGATPINMFYKIPGEYKITYQIPDKEEPLNPAMRSNTITRTYKVYSRSYFKQGNSDYSILSANFTAEDMARIYNTMQAQNLTVDVAINQELVKRYISDPSSAEHLSAYRYKYDGTTESIAITFDTSSLTNDVFSGGFQQALTLKAGDTEKIFVLIIHSTLPDYEIVLENNNFTAVNNLSKSEARRHIGAYVIKRSTGQRVDGMNLKYDFDDIDEYKYNIAQAVPITLEIPGAAKSINGIDMTVSTTATIVIVRELKYVHPEDKEPTATIFWETVSDHVRAAKPERTIRYELSYEEAAITPADFFRIVKNRDGGDVIMTMPSGIKLTFDADRIRKEPINRLIYSLAIEPMYNVYIQRDAKGAPVQQFYTHDTFTVPGTLVVTIPLNKDMPTEGLRLYKINETTGKYVQLMELGTDQVVNRNIVLEMNKFEGRYVITTADLSATVVGDRLPK